MVNSYTFKQVLEAVSKPQIALVDKTQADEKAQHTRSMLARLRRASILKRPATPSASVRWGFETASKQN
jgi:hypothetical protein